MNSFDNMFQRKLKALKTSSGRHNSKERDVFANGMCHDAAILTRNPKRLKAGVLKLV